MAFFSGKTSQNRLVATMQSMPCSDPLSISGNKVLQHRPHIRFDYHPLHVGACNPLSYCNIIITAQLDRALLLHYENRQKTLGTTSTRTALQGCRNYLGIRCIAETEIDVIGAMDSE